MKRLKSVLKWSLVALGAYLWIGLWFQRHWLLGLSQVVIVGVLLYREIMASPSRSEAARASRT